MPFFVIYVFNWIMFSIIMIKLLIAVGLSLLFGLGWGFGLTATSSGIKGATFAFQLIFSIFVGLQGVLILFFHGIRSPEFRQVWASALGLTKKRKIFSSSINPRKKQAGSEASKTCNLPALPSKVDSKSQYDTLSLKKQVCSTESSRDFLTIIEAEVSIAKEPSTVLREDSKETETEEHTLSQGGKLP